MHQRTLKNVISGSISASDTSEVGNVLETETSIRGKRIETVCIWVIGDWLCLVHQVRMTGL